MPKIIENVREQLLTEAKKQITERGYADTTIRSVASACGVGVGTVYNYFPSKEMLVATFVFDDWKKHLQDMATHSCDTPKVLLQCIYDSLQSFATENERLFSDAEAAKLVAVGSASRHQMLRRQIAALVLPVFDPADKNTPFAASFLAEALISWSIEGADFEDVYPFFEKIIKK